MNPPTAAYVLLPRVDYAEIRKTEARILGAKKSRNTQIAYRSAWKAFSAWCAATNSDALPATVSTVRDFLTWSIAQEYRLETVFLRLSAINHFHREAGLTPPMDQDLRAYLVNARRELKEGRRGKKAVTYDLLARIAGRFPDTNAGVRNRAMILLCFASGWRRSEIVALHFLEVSFCSEGVALWQRSSKTDQLAQGRMVGVSEGSREATCPVRALRAWIERRGDWDGPLFPRLLGNGSITREALEPRGYALYDALKAVIELVGEDPRPYGAHSLRAGMITEAAKAGANEWAIMARTGHRCLSTLHRYIRPAKVFDMNPLAGVL